MENGSRKKLAILKLLLGQDVEQLPKTENKISLQTTSTSYLQLKWKVLLHRFPVRWVMKF